MKTTTLFTLILVINAVGIASAAPRIPSRKISAPTHAGYTVPAASPTIPSRNAMPSAISSRTNMSALVVPATFPEPARPKILSPPVVPLPQETVQKALPVTVAEPIAGTVVTIPLASIKDTESEQPISNNGLMEQQPNHEVVDEPTTQSVYGPEAVIKNDESAAFTLVDVTPAFSRYDFRND